MFDQINWEFSDFCQLRIMNKPVWAFKEKCWHKENICILICWKFPMKLFKPSVIFFYFFCMRIWKRFINLECLLIPHQIGHLWFQTLLCNSLLISVFILWFFFFFEVKQFLIQVDFILQMYKIKWYRNVCVNCFITCAFPKLYNSLKCRKNREYF